MSKTFALFLSYLIHPAIMPVLGTAVIMLLSPVYVQKELFILVMIYVFAGTYVFPLIMVFLLKKLGVITSVHMANAQERRYPFLASILFYYLTAQSVRNFPVPEMVAYYLFVGTLMILILWAFLRILKLSAHLAGIGALTGLMIILSFTYHMELLAIISFLLILSGFLATARLVLKAHTTREIYLGFFTGIACVVLVLGTNTFRLLIEMAMY